MENKSIIKDSARNFGSQCIVIAIDAKKISEKKWEVFTHGGRKSTGLDVINYAKQVEELGAGEILLTSMDRVGTKIWYDLDLTVFVSNSFNITVIASGVVGKLDQLYDGLKKGRASAVLAASIFHFGELSINDVKKYLDSRGIPVRL